MNMISLSQIKNGSRLEHANTKKYRTQLFFTTDNAITEFIITNKPDNTYYTQYYDSGDEIVQIEINHNKYYQDEDFTFDSSSGKVVWTNTAENNGFDLTKDLCDVVRVSYAYTYEKTKMQTVTKFTFNKNNNMGPIGLIVNSKTYILNGYKASYPLFEFDPSIFAIFAKYDSSVTPTITADLFNSGGALNNFFNSCATKLMIESSGVGIFWSSSAVVRSSDDFGSAYWRQRNASAASTTGDWAKTSSNSTDISTVWNNLITAYDNGENLIVEFIG